MKKSKKSVLLCLLMVCVLLTGCGSVYESSQSGYTKVNSINGAVFDMPEQFLSQSMMISTISKDGDYGEGTYLYKDNKTYLLFNVKQVVVAVETGTNFDMSSKDIPNEIMNHTVNGVWMEKYQDKISYSSGKKSGAYKILAKVKGNISITPQYYGKYTGFFACVQKDGLQSAIFAGANLDDDEKMTADQERILKHIVKSFQISENMNGTEEKGV